MSTNQVSGASRAAVSPRRSRAAWAVPLAVGALTLALVTWSAWPLVRPARPVVVAQAVFDRSEAPSPSTENPTGTHPAIGKTVQAAGWLEAEPFSVACAALADGIVETIEVLEGDRVSKGDVVARLVAEDSELRLAAAESGLASAQARLARSRAELAAARTDWEHPVELTRAVEVARAALAEDRAELERLTPMVAQQRADLVRLEEELNRVTESESLGVATDIELIIARQRVEAQRAALASMEAREPLLLASVDRRGAELRAAERNLELRVTDRRRLDTAEAGALGAEADVRLAQVARDEAALELQRMVIRSPIDGYVQRRYKAPGDKVVRMMDDPASAHIARVYDPSKIQVRVDVPLADAAHVSVGQACEVVVEVLPDRTFRGEVLRITHEADLQKNTLEIKVGVIDPSPVLRPEMLTRVKFIGGRSSGGATTTRDEPGSSTASVPSGAVASIGGAAGVWAVTQRRGDQGVVRPAMVRVLSEQDGWSRVSGPINPGDLLVVGSDGLSPGQRVRIRAEEGGAS